MKKTTFTLLLSLSCCWLAAQCPTGDITFSTQGQIDSFQINYPGCTEIDSNVIIAGSSIVRLDSLNPLEKIGGYLWIEQTALPNLNGLNNLDSVKSFLRIIENPALIALAGLENLKYVGTGLGQNGGPSSPKEIGIEIKDNLLLTSLQGFENLKTLPCLIISYNPSLTSLIGLDSVSYIGTCGTMVDILNSYSFRLTNNDSLYTLHGLENLVTVGDILITYNYNLTSLTGLENLDSVGYWYVADNYTLSTCNIPPLCTHLENGGTATISNNAPGCNSVAEIEAACIVSIDETSTGEPVVVFSPNPASDFLQIQVSDNEKWKISLYDLRGRQMFRQLVSGSQMIWVKDWPSGIYALQAVSGERVFSGKIVKQ